MREGRKKIIMKGWRFVVEIDYYPFSVPLQYNFNFTAVKIKLYCYALIGGPFERWAEGS